MRPGTKSLAACFTLAMMASPAWADSAEVKTGGSYESLFRTGARTQQGHAGDVFASPSAAKGGPALDLAEGGSRTSGFEHYLFIQGDVGEVNLGLGGQAPHAMQFTAPYLAGPGGDSPALDAVPRSGPRAASYLLLSGKAYRIGYFTPRFGGLGGLSASGRDAAPSERPLGLLDETYRTHDIGAGYVARLKGLELAFTADHSGAAGERGITVNPQAWSFGFGLSYSGFKMGGAYHRAENLLLDSAALPHVKERGYTFGLGYGGSDWWVGTGVSRLDQGQPASASTLGGTTTYRLGGEYQVRPGMLVFSDLLLYSNDQGGAGPAAPSRDDQGALFFGLDLNF